ncbi:DUF3318 domain-containing protein [Burkholderia ambifaria]|jgi:hypothetical protein|uniref:DUF3318 domain-containing protein n=1 Tax=Burkholderia ambifaria TaxID=152480 RepID=UPI000D009F44|nr:DUF3318 domain-containing protein [Burkholderia ambifaria]ELK6206772.1 DUF3318 domain-containing protein [Burkholderia ambifaria]MBR8331726.1 DUF3318 domain-containing protein [Burkholderia ambifaria]MBR8345252.1 DUF3318 domain-containing protein [Burkholderia ambifaria]PRG02445.1 hypothetical protein C6Q14_18305 [Burkholderia ambifaria]UEP22059.1 DUF3318 domain-containing protein [Burkholderia ambifaria]
MSQNVTGHSPRPHSSRSHWSASQHRALRKELLILRSEVERLELAEAAADVRHAVTRFSWLKMFIPGLSGGTFGQSAKNLNASLGHLVNQYPMLSSLASLVLAKPIRSLLRASAGPALKWGTVGFAAWEVYRIWKQSRDERATTVNDD